LHLTGIFTGIAFSPSKSPRQSPSRYAFRARQNSPDKELRYLRTVIVTADIDEGFGQSPSALRRRTPALTFSHWSGVTPYTSSYEFAGSCVFVKQSPGVLSLRPDLHREGHIPKLRPLFCRVPL